MVVDRAVAYIQVQDAFYGSSGREAGNLQFSGTLCMANYDAGIFIRPATVFPL